MLTEVLLIALIGTAVGVVAATWALDVVRAAGPRDIPRLDDLAIDARVLIFASVSAVVVAVLAGALPAVWVAHGNLGAALKEGGRSLTSGPRTHGLRSALAVGQVTLATMLLVGAGLLARSLVSLLRVDRGYQITNVAVATVQSWQHYRMPERRAEFVRQALDRLAVAPGVTLAGMTSSLPLSPPIGADDANYVIEGRDRPVATEWPTVHAAIIAGAYFETLATPLLEGRLFDDRDRATTTPVMIVNRAFARQHFRDDTPLRKRVVIRFMGTETVREIVGVVGDMRHEGLHAAPHSTVFIPHAQSPTGALTFVVRGQRDAASALRSLRAELLSLNSAMPVEDPTTLEARLAESLRARRFHLGLLLTFSLAALVLAAIGVYGVISNATAERTHEIGVRVALGAQARNIMATVIRSGLAMVGLGVMLGAIAAAATGRALSAMLFETTAHDAVTYVLVALVILMTSLVATALPAVRAMRVAPTEALRG
jgi:putative ABC transport system permease protein